jgi:hypothetical protein
MNEDEVFRSFVHVLVKSAIVVGVLAWMLAEIVVMLGLGVFALWAILAGALFIFG